MRLILRLVAALVGSAILVLTLVWVALAVPFGSSVRQALVGSILSDQFGRAVAVNGDVNIILGPTTRVKAFGIIMPSESLEGVQLASLDEISFEVDLIALMRRTVDIDSLTMRGFSAQLITAADGRKSWQLAGQSDRPNSKTGLAADFLARLEEDSRGLLSFLKSRTADIKGIELLVRNERTGFDFDFQLSDLSLEQQDQGATLAVSSDGTINGERFELNGRYPKEMPFTTRARISTLELGFNGEPTPDGYTGALSLDAQALGDLLDVFRLERLLDGEAFVGGQITHRDGSTSLSSLDAVVRLDDGQLFAASGGIEDIAGASGIAVALDARLHAEGEAPPRARRLEDIKLARVSTLIVSQDEGLGLENLNLSTNAIDQGLGNVGPISIGQVRRTQDSLLAFEDIQVQAGPVSSPYLRATGRIGNVLALKSLSFEGTASVPASLVLYDLSDDEVQKFGGVEASFTLSDKAGDLGLTDLTANSFGTDVWTLGLDAAIGNVETLGESFVDISIDIEDGASFFSALQLEPVDTGRLGFFATVQQRQNALSGRLGFVTDTSEVNAAIDVNTAGRRRIDALVSSPSLVIGDVSRAIQGLAQLRRINDVTPDNPTQQTHSENLPDPELPELQPLVLSDKSERTDLAGFLRETDIFGEIEIENISGLQGITRLSSGFTSEGGQASLGPLDFRYGGGYFNLGAEIDLVDAPDRIKVSGATEGWNLGEIIDELDLSLGAQGTLNGRFNLAGRTTSIDAFLNSMNGTILLAMDGGRLETSLLELAGLGVFPWLFGKERARGYSDIVCLRAPVHVAGSALRFDAMVVETEDVQLVARGDIDWKRDTIALRAEPRPVGKPLSRSAWPFDVTGRLSNPKFSLVAGGARARRADGADTMPADRTPCQRDVLQLE